jgi:hypothetical protein
MSPAQLPQSYCFIQCWMIESKSHPFTPLMDGGFWRRMVGRKNFHLIFLSRSKLPLCLLGWGIQRLSTIALMVSLNAPAQEIWTLLQTCWTLLKELPAKPAHCAIERCPAPAQQSKKSIRPLLAVWKWGAHSH